MYQCFSLCYCIILKKNTYFSFWLSDGEKLYREVTQVLHQPVRMWNIAFNSEKFFPVFGFADGIASL